MPKKPLSFSVYVLRSLNDGKLYIGQTNDLEDRLKRHNQGQVRSTKSRRPFHFVYCEKFSTRSDARRREDFLKSRQGWLFLKRKVPGAQPVTADGVPSGVAHHPDLSGQLGVAGFRPVAIATGRDLVPIVRLGRTNPAVPTSPPLARCLR